jgi:hypothetical protein
VFRTKQLLLRLLLNQPVLVQIQKDCLRDFGLFGGCGAAKVVEANVEPFVNVRVDLVVFVADFLGRDAFFDGFCFDCCAVLVGAADVEGVDVADFGVAGEDVGAEDRADDVAEMGYVVDVWKCRRNKDVLLSGDG